METETRQRAFLRECFAFADENKRGFLDRRDLKCAVAAALGIRASKLILAQMFTIDANDIRVDAEDFVAVLLPRLKKTDLLEQVRRDFKAFDLRSQGFISFASFQKACALVVPHMPLKIVHEIFREADRDGDGRVTYNDFEGIYLLAEQLNHTARHQSTDASQRKPSHITPRSASIRPVPRSHFSRR